MKLTVLGIALLGVCLSAQSQVSLKEKDGLVHFHDQFTEVAPATTAETLKRELNYEKLKLKPTSRAAAEAKFIAEQIQKQVVKAYEKALAATGDADDASAQVRVDILRELERIDKQFRPEIKKLALKTLEEIRTGSVSSEGSLPALENKLLPDIEARAPHTKVLFSAANLFVPNENDRKFAEKLEYDTTEEFMRLLVSNKESTRWVATANMSTYTEWMNSSEGKVSLQLKASFLGVDLAVGPIITFNVSLGTRVNMMAEDLNVSVLEDGNFDVYKRDEYGNILYDKNGKTIRRFMAFSCEAAMKFSSEYKGEAALFVGGMGGTAMAAKTYTNAVFYNTRRVLVPNYVAGKTVTKEYLNQLCHNEFIKAHVNRHQTVKDSLKLQMKNMISSLYFSHERTKCGVDSDCQKWFKDEVNWLYRSSTIPVCVEEAREKFRECQLRALEGMSCRLKGVSDISAKLDCAPGLKCVQFREGNFFSKPKGRCEREPSTIVDFEVL